MKNVCYFFSASSMAALMIGRWVKLTSCFKKPMAYSNKNLSSNMIEIRPIWNVDLLPQSSHSPDVAALLQVEERILKGVDVFLDLARLAVDEEYVDELLNLSASARNDLIGGCEMARAGYIKQAYSLWRSWFEQSIFLMYFLESPIHRAAWQVKSEIRQDENPQFRLMLHQLLATSSEKHPFAIVYENRYRAILEVLKISGVPKSDQPIQKAGRVLTTLSQGVHGTYQPPAAKDFQARDVQLNVQCRPVLCAAEEVIYVFWSLLVTDLVALPPELLVSLRDGHISEESVQAVGFEQPQRLVEFAPFFARAFPNSKK